MPHPLDPFVSAAEGLISSKARRLSRRRGFSAADESCIRQDLWLHLVENVDEFNSDEGSWECWASVILDRRCISLWRVRHAGKRSPLREEHSLDEPTLDSDGRVVTRREITPEAASNPDRLRDLERDMAEVLRRLPDDLRSVALGLAFGTPNGVGNTVGISRRGMTRAIDQIRDIFRDAGLDMYL